MALKLQGNSLAIICQAYSSWNEVSTEVFEYFSKTQALLGEYSVTAITLEYVDEFQIDDTTNKWTEGLFNRDSKYICQHIFDVDSFWHSNHGYFNTIQEADEKIRVLNTVNISSLSETHNITKEVRHKAVIKMQHKAETNNIDILEKIMIDLHTTDKDILKNLLSADIRKMIGL